MTDLKSIVAGLLDSTDSEIQAVLNEKSITKVDTQRWTWAGLAIKFGPTAVGQIDEVLKRTAGYDWVRMLLAGGGINFSEEHTQGTLEALRGTLGDTVDALKSVGIARLSPWSDAGNEGSASAESVKSLREAIQVDQLRTDTESKWNTVQNEIVNPAIAEGRSWEEVKALIAEVD